MEDLILVLVIFFLVVGVLPTVLIESDEPRRKHNQKKQEYKRLVKDTNESIKKNKHKDDK